MALFDTLLSNLGGAGGGLGALSEVLGNGGLSGLVSRFQDAGLDDVVQSWISNSPNLPISFEQIQAALGPDMTEKLSGLMGVAPEGLTQALPEFINGLTPGGALPDLPLGDIVGQFTKGDLGAQLGGLIGGFLKR